MCDRDKENHAHLFFSCEFSKVVLREVCLVFLLHHLPTGMSAWRRWLLHLKHVHARRVQIWCAAIVGVVYGVWYERNQRVFADRRLSADLVAARVIHAVKGRVCGLNITGKSARSKQDIRSPSLLSVSSLLQLRVYLSLVWFVICSKKSYII